MASTPQPSSYTYGGQAMKNTPSSHETSGSHEELYNREKQLAMQETRLREYQERVLRYKAMKSSPFLGPFCGSELQGFSLFKI